MVQMCECTKTFSNHVPSSYLTNVFYSFGIVNHTTSGSHTTFEDSLTVTIKVSLQYSCQNNNHQKVTMRLTKEEYFGHVAVVKLVIV